MSTLLVIAAIVIIIGAVICFTDNSWEADENCPYCRGTGSTRWMTWDGEEREDMCYCVKKKKRD